MREKKESSCFSENISIPKQKHIQHRGEGFEESPTRDLRRASQPGRTSGHFFIFDRTFDEDHDEAIPSNESSCGNGRQIEEHSVAEAINYHQFRHPLPPATPVTAATASPHIPTTPSPFSSTAACQSPGSSSASHSSLRFLRRASELRHHHALRRASHLLFNMGNCCGGRDDPSVKKEAKAKWDNFLEGGDKSDTEKFDEAYARNDIEAFVALLHSAEPIDEPEEPMHPWAANPQTVGALAMTQLAILASKEDTGNMVKDQMREAGAIPLLVKDLDSEQVDRVHAAVIALSFLSVDNPKNCAVMFESGAFPPLIRLMGDPLEGVKGATAQSCRNMFVLGTTYKQAFIQAGGAVALVKLLELPSEPFDEQKDMFNQLETIYHLEDLVLEAGEEVPEFVTAVKSEGAHRLLEPLTKMEKNKDVADAAQYLLVRLAD